MGTQRHRGVPDGAKRATTSILIVILLSATFLFAGKTGYARIISKMLMEAD